MTEEQYLCLEQQRLEQEEEYLKMEEDYINDMNYDQECRLEQLQQTYEDA